MNLSKEKWLDSAERRKQLTSSDDAPDQMSNFGYQPVPKAEKTEWVRRHFNSVAHHYDFMNTLLSFGIHYLWKVKAARALGAKPGDRVLDVCGGTGDLARLAARRTRKPHSVVIYDINRAMMQAGIPNIKQGPHADRIDHIQGNAETISFADNSFDAAMVGFGIRNVTEWVQGFREMHRVLKPGGCLMCLEFSKPVWPVFRWLYDFYSFYIMPLLGQAIAGSRKAYVHLPESIRMFPMPDELAKVLEEIGFEKVTYTHLTNGIAVIHRGYKK